MIIWDDYKYGEKIYNKGEVNTKKWECKELKSFIFYLLESGEYELKDIRDKLLNVCTDDIKYLTVKQRNNIFNKLIKQCRRSIMNKDINIKIYKSEIEKIKELNNENYEKCLFLMLIYKKWLDEIKIIKDEKTNKETTYYEWFVLIKNDIFKEAKLNNMNTTAKQNMINYLHNNNYIKSEVRKLSKGEQRIENVEKKQMWSIPFLQFDGEVALEINDYENVVYRYLNYVYGGYYKCERCGILSQQNKENNKIYCTECAKNYYQPISTKTINCIDCGEEVEIDGIVKNKKRCDNCQKKYIRKLKTDKQKEYRKNK